jgi:hypothetical protein
MKDEFRCLIAALYGKEAGYARNKTVVLDTDVALRCAFYGSAELTSKEMHKGRERDGAAFVFATASRSYANCWRKSTSTSTTGSPRATLDGANNSTSDGRILIRDQWRTGWRSKAQPKPSRDQ